VRLGLEGLYRLLQTVVGLAQEVIQPYNGTVIPTMSEGFMAVFGVPMTQEDHARRAVLAALDRYQRLHQHPILRAQISRRRSHCPHGASLGPGGRRGLGQEPQRYTAIGEPTFLAMRLQQRAAPGTILLSAATYALVHAVALA
jgi:class 3 adenylate cyclase